MSKQTYTKLLVLIALNVIAFSSRALASNEEMNANDDSEISISEIRAEHAKELLGKGYLKSASKKNETDEDVVDFVGAVTKKFLPKKFLNKSEKISNSILEASQEFELDPLFLVAVIQNESSFNPNRKGGAGEIGLMQIKPSTAKWIAKKYSLKYKNDKSLYDPSINIWIGAALMDQLRSQFDSNSRLYLSAYNAGAKKVRTMVSEKRSPKEYVLAVMKRYKALYRGFKKEGSAIEQSEVAFANTIDLTRKPSSVQAKVSNKKKGV